MTDQKSIAFDATFTILYIGFAAATIALSLLLLTMVAFDVAFGRLEIAALVMAVAGWILLPLAPLLYRRMVGHRFSWRSNGVLGSVLDA